jgi:hypothetical protein
VVKDDFMAAWAQPEQVSSDPRYRSCYGNIHYLQILKRDHSLVLRPNQQYRLTISFEPQVIYSEDA